MFAVSSVRASSGTREPTSGALESRRGDTVVVETNWA